MAAEQWAEAEAGVALGTHSLITRDTSLAGTGHIYRPGSDPLDTTFTVFLYRRGFPLRDEFDLAILRLQVSWSR